MLAAKAGASVPSERVNDARSALALGKSRNTWLKVEPTRRSSMLMLPMPEAWRNATPYVDPVPAASVPVTLGDATEDGSIHNVASEVAVL